MSTVSTLYTGLPRNGKTLFVVEYLDKISKDLVKEGRKLYVNGIPELKVEHEPLEDPDKWYEVPVGSVIVIDEAQRIFPVRHTSKEPPQKIREFETLGHRGLQAIIITQHPSLIDPELRRLIGRHVHVERMFGSTIATLFEWPRVVTPESKKDRRDAQKTKRSYPKHIYPLYKSSELHTVERKIPPMVKHVLTAFLLCVIGLIYAFYHFSHNRNPLGKETPASADLPVPTSTQQPAGPVDNRSRVLTTPEYLRERIPRLAGLPHTAPHYDAVMTPRRAPKPVACVSTPKRCSCYSQSGTKMPTVDENVCRDIAANGYFDDTQEDGDRAGMGRSGAERESAPPASPQEVRPRYLASIGALSVSPPAAGVTQ